MSAERPTARAFQALRLYAQLGSRKEVAAEMGVSLQTIRNYLNDCYRYLNADNNVDAFRAMGWLVVR